MKISGEALSLARSGAGRGMEARGRVPSDSYGAIVRGPVGTLGRRRMRSGGNQSPLAGLWFGRFFVCPCGAALRELRPRAGRLWEWATSSHVIIDMEVLAHPAIPLHLCRLARST